MKTPQTPKPGAKEIFDLVSKGIDQAPPIFRPVLVIAGLGSLITFAVGMGLISARQHELGYKIAIASLVFLCVTLGCVVILVRFGHRSTQAKESKPAKEIPAVATGTAAESDKKPAAPDAVLRAICCPKHEPTAPAKLDAYSVYHLWADPRGSSIKATFNDDDAPDYLILEFENKRQGWASNVTLRPCGLSPYLRGKEDRYLCLEFLLPGPIDADPMDRVALSFRIYDENGTIWFLGQNENDLAIKQVKTGAKNKWSTLSLPLDPTLWKPFNGDGNNLSRSPTPAINEMILAVVLVVGAWQGANKEPGAGKGKLLVRNIRFEKEVPAESLS
jgi:hypothetical protein